MIISKIIKSDNVYYNLHAEQTVTGTFLDEPGSGVFEEMLTNTTLERVITDCENYTNHNIILNFEQLTSCQTNLKKKFKAIIAREKALVLINVDKEIIQKLEVDFFINENNVINSNKYEIFYVSKNDKINFESNLDFLFNETFVSKLKQNIELKGEKDIPHYSSSVYLTSYINIKSFISKEKSFFIYAIYQLALKIKKHWEKEIHSVRNNERPTLICQNLNSSYIVSVLSSLLKLDILILDQIGPINKLYSTLDNKIEENKKYIVVSDLVCLGTEIKIAKSLIEFLGGRYIGNVSIIRIETLLPIDKEFSDTECVFTITKDNNKDIGYQIKTALNFD